MTKVTLAELISGHIFVIRRKLPDRLYPFQTIAEEINVFNRPDIVFLVAADGVRVSFDKRFLTLVRKIFKDAEWFLSQPSKKKYLKGTCVLIGVLPHDHLLLLAPRKESVA